jgi:CRP-like cAMP-binding protein
MIAIMSKPAFFANIEAVCPATAAFSTCLAVGEPLFRQGDTSPGLTLVLDGQVDLMRWTSSGRAVKIHTARAGETFAEASLFARACHCDAVAAVPTQLTTIRKTSVLTALVENPDLSTALMHHLAASLMQARRLLELRATSPLTEAVLARLSELVDAQGWLPENIPLQSLATDAGVTAPALYRALAMLERNGLVERPSRGRVLLL